MDIFKWQQLCKIKFSMSVWKMFLVCCNFIYSMAVIKKQKKIILRNTINFVSPEIFLRCFYDEKKHETSEPLIYSFILRFNSDK